MKILDVTNITSAAQMPIKKGTLQFIQDAYKECINAILRGTIGGAYSASTYYILHGCANSGVGSNYVISAGAIFYNGEIYLVDATTFTTTGGQVPVMNVATTQYTTNADPVTFTNGVAYDVHDIRKIAITAGTASGNEYGVNSNNVFVNYANSTANIIEQQGFNSLKTKVFDITGWNMDTTATISQAHGIGDFKKIRNIQVMIVDNNNTILSDIAIPDNSGLPSGSIIIGSTSITVYRQSGGAYDSALYNNANGTITIVYEA